MGGVIQVAATDWCALTGGQPNADWTALETTTAVSPTNAFQYRPSKPADAQKKAAQREEGLASTYSKQRSLLDFAEEVGVYLKRTGLDTIA